MEKKYLITTIIPGKEQLFLKSNNGSIIDWVNNPSEAMINLTLEDAENEKQLLINYLESNGFSVEGIKIIEL